MNENELTGRNNDMLPVYQLNYSQAPPNRFAKGILEDSLVVVLEPELAQIFKTPERVKAILEAKAQNIPQHESQSAQRLFLFC